jgi:hypothetical protein
VAREALRSNRPIDEALILLRKAPSDAFTINQI